MTAKEAELARAELTGPYPETPEMYREFGPHRAYQQDLPAEEASGRSGWSTLTAASAGSSAGSG